MFINLSTYQSSVIRKSVVTLLDIFSETSSKEGNAAVQYLANLKERLPKSDSYAPEALGLIRDVANKLIEVTEPKKIIINPKINRLRLESVNILHLLNTIESLPEASPLKKDIAESFEETVKSMQKKHISTTNQHRHFHNRSTRGLHPVPKGTYGMSQPITEQEYAPDDIERFKPPSGWQGR